MTKWNCTDGNCDVEIEADTMQEAAQEYADGGSWGEVESTLWIDVYCVPHEVWTADYESDEERDDAIFGAREMVTVTLDPPEPDCIEAEHDWQSPHDIVGGIAESPGVWGSGGGIKSVEVCMHCGCGRHIDTWASRPDTGEQGMESTHYVVGEFDLPTRCDRCGEAITEEERELDWPITVADNADICPSCYGEDAHCGECGDVLEAVEGAKCPHCDCEGCGIRLETPKRVPAGDVSWCAECAPERKVVAV